MQLVINFLTNVFAVFFISLALTTQASAQFDNNPISQAVDNTSFNFFGDTGAQIFFNQRNTFNFDGDAAQSANIRDNEISLIATSIRNATSVTFDWKVSSEAGFDFLAVVVLDANFNPINGLTRRISGEQDWATVTINVPSNTSITWGYIKDSSASSGSDTGWVDNIRIGNTGGETEEEVDPGPQDPTQDSTVVPSLSEALDNSDFEFTSGGNLSLFAPFGSGAKFFNQSRVSVFDGDAAQSGNTFEDSESSMLVYVPDAAVVQFDWKVSSEKNSDFFYFAVRDRDGGFTNIQRRSISGETKWSTQTVNIPSGGHFLVWAYVKDITGSAGSDAGWVDNVRIGNTGGEGVPNPAPPTGFLPSIMNILLDDE